MSFMVPSTLVDSAVIVLVFLWLRSNQRRKTSQPPPGPKGYPLIGNVFDMMVPELWNTAIEWKDKYGDLIFLKCLGKPFLLINSYDAAVDLLEKRALNYSDRPTSVMLNDLQRWDWNLVNLQYGETWRRKRTPVQRFSELVDFSRYEDVQKNEVQKLLRNLLRSPQDFETHIQTCMASYIMMLTYGHEVHSLDDQFISLSKEGNKQILEAIKSGGYLVDSIPWLKYIPKWFPGAGFQVIAEQGAKLSRDVRLLPYLDAKQKFFSGSATPCFLTHQMEERLGAGDKLTEEDEEIMSATCGICYSAGADTTGTSLVILTLAMVLYPEVQKRAQEEIDRVVGGGRLPDLSDREQLPYCVAVCKEIQRWQPIIPLGVPHQVRDDDTYNGFFIPGGTTVLPNQWAMLRDPEEYPDPDVFRPERYLGANGERVQRDPYKVAFGFGRRICPGRNFASNTIFLLVVQMLSVFNISKTKGADGVDVDPVIKIKVMGIVRFPEPFDCSIQPRSSATSALVPIE